MQFTELMMLHTSPLHWEPSPSLYAQGLKDFLRYLVDPNKPGRGALLDQRASKWQDAGGASRWIDVAHEKVWQPGAQALEDHGRAISESVFHTYNELKAVVFLDEERLRTCLKTKVPSGTSLSFSVDWTFIGSVAWTPQLYICNYWPRNTHLAPDPPPGAFVPPPLEAEDAARVLRDGFWLHVEREFRKLRYGFGLGEASIMPRLRSFNPPVFYYAKPILSLKEYKNIQNLEHLPPVRTLACRLFVTDDLSNKDVSGALLRQNILTLRREVERADHLLAYYLLLPWVPEEEDVGEQEVQQRVASVTNSLSYVEFSAAYNNYDIVTDLEIPQASMTLWRGTLNNATSTVRDLQLLVAFESDRGRREITYGLVGQLRSSLSRLESQLLIKTDDLLRLQRKWDLSKKATIRSADRILAASDEIGDIPSLLEALKNIGPYRLYEEYVQEGAQRARRLRRRQMRVSNLLASLQSTVDEHQREEQEREDANGRIISYGLAGLATVTAFTLLIGEQDWAALQQEIGRWTGLFGWIGAALQVSHSTLVIVATVSAAIFIAALFALLVRAFLPMDRMLSLLMWWRRDRLSDLGKDVGELHLLEEVATPKVDQLRQVASAATANVDMAEIMQVKHLRKDIAKLDEQACERLVEAWNWLEEKSSQMSLPNSIANSKAYTKALHARTEWFVISTELLANRPIPFPLPTALCLYRYRYDSVGSQEFEMVLGSYGFGQEEVTKIDALVKEHTHLPPQEFLDKLRRAGVSALREKPVKLADDQPDQTSDSTGSKSGP
jgi:hypothetical protein